MKVGLRPCFHDFIMKLAVSPNLKSLSNTFNWVIVNYFFRTTHLAEGEKINKEY